jgi:hypothetical protein
LRLVYCHCACMNSDERVQVMGETFAIPYARTECGLEVGTVCGFPLSHSVTKWFSFAHHFQASGVG